MKKKITPDELKLLTNEIFTNPKKIKPIVVNETLRLLKIHYYNGDPVVSDVIYDKLEKHVKSLWPELSVLSEVGARVKQNTVELEYLLGSLDKVHNDPNDSSSLSWFDGRKELIVSEKLDGSSIFMTFNHGELEFAATRGDGKFGSDITHKAKVFCKSFLPLAFKGKICVRGETALIGDSHIKLGMKNRRNGVVGVIKNEVYTGVEHVVVKCYELIDIFNKDEESILPKDEYSRWKLMEELKLPTPNWQKVILTENENRGWLFRSGVKTPRGSIAKCNLKMLIHALEKSLDNKRENLDYDIDGYVIADVNSLRENVKYPKNKIAFKKNADSTITLVQFVQWNVSRTGKLVPLVYVEPIDIDGITIQKASGFNAEFIEANGISQGSEVSIVRSGDVIPYINKVKKGFRLPSNLLPKYCSCCENVLVRKGVDLVCTNDDCTIQKEKKLVHFLRTLGVEEMSYPTVRKLGWTSIEDAYNFDEIKSAQVSGLGKRSVEVIKKQLSKTLNVTPIQLLAAFGITNCSKNTSEAILDQYEFEKVFNLRKEDLISIDGIGETTAEYIVDEIKSWVKTYEFLLVKGLKLKKEVKGDKLEGKSYCFTGKMFTMKRGDAEKLVKSLGGKIKGVNKELTALVTNTPNSGSSKNKKARELGVPVITEDEFFESIK